MKETLWGIDLGGTKIEGVILRSRTEPEVLFRQRVPTEKEKGYEHILSQIVNLIQQLSKASGLQPERIGMGTPGVLDPILKTMKNCNATQLNGQALQQDLETKLGIPFTLANDANCFAIAEANMGIVQDILPQAAVVFGVIMGTGVGGGIVVNGKVLTGRQGISGEWGHNFLDESGGLCYCEKIGCVETIIAGPALEKYYHSISGERLSLKEIVAQKAANKFAEATIQRLHHYFGKAISNIINTIDPDAIVLGGGVGNIDSLYTAGIEAAKPFVFNNRLDTVFLKPKLGDSAGVFGAALL